MKLLRNIHKGFIFFLVPLVAILFTNAAVNKHYHRWHGMMVEHAHPFKTPITGQPHQHSDSEFVLFNLLTLDKIDEQPVFQPSSDLFCLESEFSFAFVTSNHIISKVCQSRLRAPPVF